MAPTSFPRSAWERLVGRSAATLTMGVTRFVTAPDAVGVCIVEDDIRNLCDRYFNYVGACRYVGDVLVDLGVIELVNLAHTGVAKDAVKFVKPRF